MIFISGVMSIIIQKNTLCANKILVICFCPNCVISPPSPPKKRSFSICLFIFWRGPGRLLPLPLSLCTNGLDHTKARQESDIPIKTIKENSDIFKNFFFSCLILQSMKEPFHQFSNWLMLPQFLREVQRTLQRG